MTGLELRELQRAKRREAFFGKRYWYATPNEGRQEIGVLRGLGDDSWIVGYIRESGGRKRIKTRNLPMGSDPRVLQDELDSWAIARGLVEVTD